VLGTVKVKPTAQYYPLRFHCVRMLTVLSRRSKVFVTVLPLLLDVLVAFDVNKGNQRISMKPLDINCVLRVSKGQQLENGYKDAVVETVYCCLLDYLSVESSSVGFPDLVLPLVVQVG
jgi:nucleolar complex protein 2